MLESQFDDLFGDGAAPAGDHARRVLALGNIGQGHGDRVLAGLRLLAVRSAVRLDATVFGVGVAALVPVIGDDGRRSTPLRIPTRSDCWGS